MDIKSQLSNSIAECIGLSASDISAMLETPPDPKMGDAALPCFKLAKSLRKAPPKIAAEIAEKLSIPDGIEHTEIKGGYLNFFFDRTAFAEDTITKVEAEGEKYGSSDMGAGRVVCMDYSSINIAKPFHIGHLSTTAIGNSLYRIYNFLGFKSVGINHLGDWGTQFGKLIVAYKLWGDESDINARGVRALFELYVKYHQEAENKPEMDDDARAWFKKIEDGDEEALSLFSWFKELTLKDVSRVYDLLGVTFDSYAGESFYNDKMQPVIDELKEKGLLELSEGAYVVRLDDADLPPCIILKSDGTTLYATRDLAAAFYRKKHYDFYKSLYVVAYQQNLHFKQIFKVLEMMGCEWSADCEHVSVWNGVLDRRHLIHTQGQGGLSEDVLAKAIEKTTEIIEEKSPNLENKDEVAKTIGVGAVVFSVLSNSRIKDITFDFDRVLNFDGETGPYCQYTHARCCSVLRKAGAMTAEPDYAALASDQAFAVLRIIESFPEDIVRAMQKNEPSIITRQVVALAQAFNRFYYDVRIIDDDAAGTAARVALAKATAQVIKTGLYLIGVGAPDRM